MLRESVSIVSTKPLIGVNFYEKALSAIVSLNAFGLSADNYVETKLLITSLELDVVMQNSDLIFFP